jgi:hypothetical protein
MDAGAPAPAVSDSEGDISDVPAANRKGSETPAADVPAEEEPPGGERPTDAGRIKGPEDVPR